MKNEDLKLANEVRLNAYCPYSNYQVGAVLRTKEGKIYTGCNVENNGIQSICAERCAFVKAISDGAKNFSSITIVGGKKDSTKLDECLPCGYCRQFISEFVDEDFKIYTINNEYKIKDLLPHSFKM